MGDEDLLQPATARKGVGADLGHGFGNDQTIQRGTVAEGVLADGGQPRGKLNAFDARAVVEGVVCQGERVGHLHGSQALGDIVPHQVGQLGGVIAATADVGDGQGFERGASGQYGLSHFHNVCGNGQIDHGGASGVGRLAQEPKGRGERDCGQGGAIRKGFRQDLPGLFGDGHVAQSGAAAEGPSTDHLGYGGQGDRLKPRAGVEGTVLYGGHGGGQGGFLQRRTGVEYVLAHVGDVAEPGDILQGGATGERAIPQRAKAGGGIDPLQGGAAHEDTLGDRGQFCGQNDRRQGDAFCEGILAHIGDGIGQGDGLQALALFKGATANPGCGALQGYGLQTVKALEGHVYDLGRVADGQGLQPVEGGAEQPAQGHGGFGGLAEEGDGQGLKPRTTAQGVGLEELDRLGNIQKGQARAIGKGVGLDLLQPVGEGDGLQTGAIGERPRGQGAHACGNGYRTQGNAVTEGVTAQLCQPRGETEARQLGAAVEGAVADRFHRVGKANLLHAATAPEGVAADGGRFGDGDARQRMGDAVTAAEEVSDRVLAGLVHAGVGGRQRGEGLAVRKDLHAHMGQGVGEGDGSQGGATAEGAAVQGDKALGKADLGQGSASLEGGDGDGGQTAAEGQLLQLAASRKGGVADLGHVGDLHLVQILTISEGSLSDSGGALDGHGSQDFALEGAVGDLGHLVALHVGGDDDVPRISAVAYDADGAVFVVIGQKAVVHALQRKELLGRHEIFELQEGEYGDHQQDDRHGGDEQPGRIRGLDRHSTGASAQALGNGLLVQRRLLGAALVGAGQRIAVEVIGVVAVHGRHHLHREIHAGVVQLDGGVGGEFLPALCRNIPLGHRLGSDHVALDIELFDPEGHRVRPLGSIVAETEEQVLFTLLAKHNELPDGYQFSELRGCIGALGNDFFFTHDSISLFLVLEDKSEGQKRGAGDRSHQRHGDDSHVAAHGGGVGFPKHLTEEMGEAQVDADGRDHGGHAGGEPVARQLACRDPGARPVRQCSVVDPIQHQRRVRGLGRQLDLLGVHAVLEELLYAQDLAYPIGRIEQDRVVLRVLHTLRHHAGQSLAAVRGSGDDVLLDEFPHKPAGLVHVIQAVLRRLVFADASVRGRSDGVFAPQEYFGEDQHLQHEKQRCAADQ